MSDYIVRPERVYQNNLVKFFKDKLGYEYLGNLQYPKDNSSFKIGGSNSPVIEDELRKFLVGGGKYSDYQINEAIAEIKREATRRDNRIGALSAANNVLYETLISHIAIQPDPESPHENVCLFDFDNPEANNFAIAEEVSYTDPLTGSSCRPDLVVYINGIAVVVIELKRSTVSLEEGIKQNLSNETHLIPSFFTTVQFTVAASDANGLKYGTILTPFKFWCPWKRDHQEVGKPLTDMESFELFFDKKTFFELFRYGVIYDGGVKKVMRPHQYYALKAAMPRLKEKSSGVIWHSQGSGKSLTMVWLAKYIRRNFPDPRVLVITDRTELDLQIDNVFRGTKEPIYRARSSNDLLETLQNGTEWLVCSLIHKFGRHIDPVTKKEIIGDDDAPIPMETYLKELQELVNGKYNGRFEAKGTNKFVFVDECHRTQGGRLHEAMRLIMGDDVMFIGFTGTPLLRSQKAKGGYRNYKKEVNASENKFGEFIHTYLHKEAVDDKVILDLQYEARDVEQCITDKAQLDEKLETILRDTSEDNRQRIKDRWATMEKVYSSADRISRIGYSILDDMSNAPLEQDWCNAMLVAGNIYSAYKYYEFFQNRCTNKTLRGRCAVVTSYTPSDYDLRKNDDGDNATEQESEYKNKMARQSYADLGVTDADKYEATAKYLFINAPARMKLLIVVDKLLTGFDAPSATYLYIDKDMRDHNLFQAICRVNRLGTDLKRDPDNSDSDIIFSNKEYGFIIDYKHLFNKIKTAVSDFNSGGFSDYDREDIEGLLEDAISKNKKRLKAALEAYDALRAEWEREGILGNADKIAAYYTPFPSLDLPEEERNKILEDARQKRFSFYKIAQNLVTAYTDIADYILRAGFTEEEAAAIRKKVSEASYLIDRVKVAAHEDFDVRMHDPKMRELLDRFIRADDAKTLVPATADFTFLDMLTSTSDTDKAAGKAEKEAGSKKAAAEVIVANNRMVINNWYLKDKALAKAFSQQLQEIIDEMKKETETTVDTLKKLIELAKAMKGIQQTPEGIDSPFAKALWNNRKDWTGLEEDSEVMALVIKVEDFFQTQVYAGWKDPSELACEDCLSGLQNLLDENYAPFGIHPTMEQIYTVHRIAANNIKED